MSRHTPVAVVATLAGLAGCAGSLAPPRVSPTPGAVQYGLATYYSDSLAGRPTASGEPYDPGAMTAAHRTLPLGSTVNVQREDGSAAVTVRINDRGPYGQASRIVDLSRAAAMSLHMIAAGVVPVVLRVVSVPVHLHGH